MTRYPILLFALLAAFSCSGQKTQPPPSVLAPGPFADLYVDLLKLGTRPSASALDTLARMRNVDSLLQAHGTTREAVKASVEWYNRDPSGWKAIMDSATSKLERQQNTRP